MMANVLGGLELKCWTQISFITHLLDNLEIIVLSLPLVLRETKNLVIICQNRKKNVL